MSNHNSLYIEVGPGVIDRAHALAAKLTDLLSLNLGMLNLAATVDVFLQSLEESESKDRHVFCLDDPSILTEVEYEALNRVLHILSQKTDIEAEIRFRSNSDWNTQEPPIYKPNEVPFIESTVITTGNYLEVVEKLKEMRSTDPVSFYLQRIFTYTLVLVQAAKHTPNDAHLVQVTNEVSFLVDNRGNLLAKAVMLIEDVMFEISEACKRRFSFNVSM